MGVRLTESRIPAGFNVQNPGEKNEATDLTGRVWPIGGVIMYISGWSHFLKRPDRVPAHVGGDQLTPGQPV